MKGKKNRGDRRGAGLLLVALLVLLVASGCSLCRQWCERQGFLDTGVTLLDGDGNATDRIDLYDNLRVAVADLEPSTRHTLRVVGGTDRRELAHASLISGHDGSLAPITLLFAENLFPCVPQRATETLATMALDRSVERPVHWEGLLARLREWQGRLAASTYYLEVLEGERLVRRAPFSIGDLGQPRIYTADSAGCLRGGFNRDRDDVYVVGRNFPAGSTVRLYTVADQRIWREGDPIRDLSGRNGEPQVEVVRLAANQSEFAMPIWAAGASTSGLYDVIARIGDDDSSHYLANDLVTAQLDVGFLVQLDATGPHIEQNMTVPATDGVAYYTHQDKYFNTDDVWVAINPKDSPSGATPDSARIYVVSHLPEDQWTDGKTLNDVSGGYETVSVKGTCRNQNEVKVWDATPSQPLTNGDYDVVVDFSPFGSYDQGQDIIDELDNKGFQVVDPSALAIVYPINPLKVFPEAEVPGGYVKKHIVGVARTTPGATVFWDSLDVDDPTSDTSPVDPNGSSGDDNRGNLGSSPGGPDGDDGRLSGENASGVASNTASSSGISLVTFEVTQQPGDNFRLKASNSASFSSPSESATITVWRKLHVEVDSMGAPTGTQVTGNITAVSYDSVQNRSTVTVSANLNDNSAGGGGGTTACPENGRFENGTLTAGGNSYPVITDNGSNQVTVTGQVGNNQSFTLVDDDVVPTDVPSPDIGDMVRAYGRAFILPVFDTGMDSPTVTFDLNTSKTEIAGQIQAGKGTAKSTADYWAVSVQAAYQTGPYSTTTMRDNDPDHEGTWRAVGSYGEEGVLMMTESIRDWIDAPNCKDGAGGVDPDTTGATPRQPRRQEILVHEVGHVFQLWHSHGAVTTADPNGGVMRPSCCPANTRQSSDFTQTSLDQLRRRAKPGA